MAADEVVANQQTIQAVQERRAKTTQDSPHRGVLLDQGWNTADVNPAPGNQGGFFSWAKQASEFFGKVLEAIQHDTLLSILWVFGVPLLILLAAVLALANDLSAWAKLTEILVFFVFLVFLFVYTLWEVRQWERGAQRSEEIVPPPSIPAGALGLPRMRELLLSHPDFDPKAQPPEVVQGDLVLWVENGHKSYIIATNHRLYFVIDREDRRKNIHRIEATLALPRPRTPTSPKIGKTRRNDDGLLVVDIDARQGWVYNGYSTSVMQRRVQALLDKAYA